MKYWIFSFVIVALLTFSCAKKENIQENGIEAIGNLIEAEEINHPSEEIMYVNSPEGLRVRKEPGIESERIFLLNDKEKVIVLEKDTTEQIIDGLYGNWFFIETDKIAGWVFSGYLMNETEFETKLTGMNKLRAMALIFEDFYGNPGNISLNENEGSYKYDYGLNTVTVDYWKKAMGFDADYQFNNRYYPDEYKQMEIKIETGVNDFNSIYFNQNIRRNKINDIVFVDSFCFSVFESESIFLSRRIYFSTNNYNIRITILGLTGLSNNMIEEAPHYFRIRSPGQDDVEYNAETKETGWAVWDYKNNAIQLFGDDLIAGRHESKTVNDWFIETEKILAGIKVI